jgi:hypothetical protein
LGAYGGQVEAAEVQDTNMESLMLHRLDWRIEMLRMLDKHNANMYVAFRFEIGEVFGDQPACELRQG